MFQAFRDCSWCGGLQPILAYLSVVNQSLFNKFIQYYHSINKSADRQEITIT